MAAQLLIEQLSPTESNMIHESSTDGKTLWFNGIFMQSNIQNKNGRNYPLNEISEAVQTAMQRIKENNGVFGELEHPSSLQINSDRISHVITELWMVGNNAHGKCRILSTPMGNIAKELINSGVRMGISSRGAGNVNESGMVSSFNYITSDIVVQPSGPSCYPTAVYESLVDGSGKKVMSLAEQVRNDTAAQKYFKKEILKWINNMDFKK